MKDEGKSEVDVVEVVEKDEEIEEVEDSDDISIQISETDSDSDYCAYKK